MPASEDIEAARGARSASEKEWGEYVALDTIVIDGVVAFTAGHAVPVSHVESGLVSKDEVARRSTKAAQAVTAPEG